MSQRRELAGGKAKDLLTPVPVFFARTPVSSRNSLHGYSRTDRTTPVNELTNPEDRRRPEIGSQIVLAAGKVRHFELEVEFTGPSGIGLADGNLVARFSIGALIEVVPSELRGPSSLSYSVCPSGLGPTVLAGAGFGRALAHQAIVELEELGGASIPREGDGRTAGRLTETTARLGIQNVSQAERKD